MNIYIMAAGKSSRFNYEPKINYTFEANKELLKKYFQNIFIVTTPTVFKNIKDDIKNDKDVNFIISSKFGKGSGKDVYTLYKMLKTSIVICWSDVFLNEENIKIINAVYKHRLKKNIMTVSYRENPYVSIKIDDEICAHDYEKNSNIKEGYQDNSIFYIYSLEEYNEVKEFMDFIKQKCFLAIKTKNPVLYFNTKEELENILKSKEFENVI